MRLDADDEEGEAETAGKPIARQPDQTEALPAAQEHEGLAEHEA
jgi:hypothetical protein